jgi:hypothetical protein
MKARKYKFESESIAIPLITNLTANDKYVIINGNPDFEMIPAINPNYNAELPTDLENNYPFIQTQFTETAYCVDVLWSSEPDVNWSNYEIKIPISPLMIHKFDKFGLSQTELIPVINDYLNSYNTFLFKSNQIILLDRQNPKFEDTVLDDIRSIHNTNLCEVGDNSYVASVGIFDNTTKIINFSCKLVSSNPNDRFYLHKYASHGERNKTENPAFDVIFTLEPGQEISSNLIVEHLNVLDFKYVKAEGGQATDKAHILELIFA